MITLEHKTVKIELDTEFSTVTFNEDFEIVSADTGIKVLRDLTKFAWQAARDCPENLEEYLRDVRELTGKYLYDDEECRKLAYKLVREMMGINNSMDYILGSNL